jgi:hypothetical protein
MNPAHAIPNHPVARPMFPGHVTLLILVLSLGLATSCRAPRPGDFEPSHPDVLQTILETSAICPEGYTLIEVPNFLRAMGMRENPGFITNTSELEAMSRFGGSDPFLLVYGTGNTICMMVNGIFFPDTSRIEAFVQDLEARRRLRIAVYEKPTHEGSWIIICAVDPSRTYSATERAAIQAGLERQHNNLGTRLRFNRLWEAPP